MDVQDVEPVGPPARLLELIGGGSNAFTAAEGSLPNRSATAARSAA